MRSNREQYVWTLVALAVSAFILDRLVVGPYIEHRASLVTRRDEAAHDLAEGHRILDQERRLRRTLEHMGDSIKLTPSEVEGQLLHRVQDWKQQAGVASASFQRVRSIDERGFTHMTFQVSGGGPMGAVAMLVYRVETAPIPLRVDDLELTPRGDGNEVQVRLTISTVCRIEGGERSRRADTLVSLSESRP